MMPWSWQDRRPCSVAELEQARAVMFRLFASAERDPNCVRGFLLASYAVELAHLVAGDAGLQQRLRPWYRSTCVRRGPSSRRGRRAERSARRERPVTAGADRRR